MGCRHISMWRSKYYTHCLPPSPILADVAAQSGTRCHVCMLRRPGELSSGMMITVLCLWFDSRPLSVCFLLAFCLLSVCFICFLCIRFVFCFLFAVCLLCVWLLFCFLSVLRCVCVFPVPIPISILAFFFFFFFYFFFLKLSFYYLSSLSPLSSLSFL